MRVLRGAGNLRVDRQRGKGGPGHRTIHAFSQAGRELIRLPGLAWLREMRGPVASAIFDGEAVAGDGSEGIQAVFEARTRPGGPTAFAAFDVLDLDGHSVMAEPWTARRKRLEDLLEAPPPGVCFVLVTDDAQALWDTWVGMGDEGIVLKERTSVYRPGMRTLAWLNLKPKLTLEVVVTGGSAERVRWGDWGEACDARVSLHASADRRRRGDLPGGARGARSALRSHDGARRACVLGRDAERDATASPLGRHPVGCSPRLSQHRNLGIPPVPSATSTSSTWSPHHCTHVATLQACH